MVDKSAESSVCFAALMPHAPVLVPPVGRDRIHEVAQSVAAMRAAARRLVGAQPAALVVVSPHSPRRTGAFGIWGGCRCRGTLAAFGAAEVRVDLPADPRLAGVIAREASAREIATWAIGEGELDHGAVVPLWFLVEAGWHGPTVVVSLNYPGEAGVAEFGEAVGSSAGSCGSRIALVASGDMSHRLTRSAPAGYEPSAFEFDRWLINTILCGDYPSLDHVDPALELLAGEDALDSVLLAAGACGFDATGHEVLSYEGPFGVGYGVAILHDTHFAPRALNPKDEIPWSHH